jgi:hypothetical protein
MIKDIDGLKAKDWVILRLLYYIMAHDVSSVNVRDISKTLDFLNYVPTKVRLEAFALIEREYTIHRQRDMTGSKAMREVRMKWNDSLPPWPEPGIQEQVDLVLAKALGLQEPPNES